MLTLFAWCPLRLLFRAMFLYLISLPLPLGILLVFHIFFYPRDVHFTSDNGFALGPIVAAVAVV